MWERLGNILSHLRTSSSIVERELPEYEEKGCFKDEFGDQNIYAVINDISEYNTFLAKGKASNV